VKALSALLCLSLLPGVSYATGQYRVEVMMFAYLDENSAREEHWPLLEERAAEEEAAIEAALAEADNEQQTLEDVTPPEEDTPELAEEPETPKITLVDDLEFQNAADRFAYRSDMKIVWHQAWIEELQDSENAHPHEISAQYEEDNFRVTVSGALSLYRSRYIHIQPELEVDQWIFTIPDDAPITSDTPAEDTSASITAGTTDSMGMPGENLPPNQSTDSVTQAPEMIVTPAVEPEPEWVPLRAAQVDRSRRMRSDEVHYLDHPLLGMVVKVTPYEAPSDDDANDTPESGSSAAQ